MQFLVFPIFSPHTARCTARCENAPAGGAVGNGDREGVSVSIRPMGVPARVARLLATTVDAAEAPGGVFNVKMALLTHFRGAGPLKLHAGSWKVCN